MNKMKSKIFFGILLAMLSQSCSKFLDENPDNFISPVNFYKTEADAVAAVNAVYDVLSEWGAYEREIYLMTELSTDNMDLNGRNQARLQLDDYVIDPNNNIIRDAWQSLFDGVNRANTVIGNVPAAASIPEAVRKRVEAEARFLRAFYYFNLVRLYGDVPLLTSETQSLTGLDVAREPVAKVYELIVEDLKVAESNLPLSYTGINKGRITQGAAKSLLAKVYLTMAGNPLKDTQKWSLAAAKALEVINSNQYALWDNYADNFAIPLKNGKESVFEGQTQANNAGNDVSRIYTNFAPSPQNPFGQRAYGGFLPTLELYNTYESSDERKELYLTQNYTTPKGVAVKVTRPYINKYVDSNGSENNNSNNWPYIRYADVLLMYAEAANETGNALEALKYLNKVRNRAGLGDVLTTDQAQLRDIIANERRLELAFEGHRWFDLVRTGKLISTMLAKGKTNIKDYHVLYPIPQRERDVNPKLSQNPGYGQ